MARNRFGMFIPAAMAILAIAGCGRSDPARGSVIEANPGNLSSRIESARSGDVIRLAPGQYGSLTIMKHSWSPALRLDASNATFSGLVFLGASGVAVEGGKIVGPGGRSYGVSIRDAHNIRIANMQISDAHRGIVVNESSDVDLVGNQLVGLVSDGIDIALSARVLVDRNSCRDFHPTLAEFAPDGTKIHGGDHPDCIQAWSRPNAAPTSDITVTNNTAEGAMQGIFFGNHVRNGVDDGGFDRIVIRNNHVRISFPNGIAMSGARDSTVTANVVETIPGAMLPKGGAAKANLHATGDRIKVCGNVVTAVRNAPGTEPCGS